MSEPERKDDAVRVEEDLIALTNEARLDKNVRAYLKRFLRPGYHLKKIREDFFAAKHALENRDLEQLREHPLSFAKAIRGRLFAAYFLVGPFGMLGLIGGAWFQYTTTLPGKGTLTYAVTILLGNVCATIGYQIIWAFFHRSFYWGKVGFGRGFVAMQRDLLPLQWRGLKLFMTAIVVLAPAFLLALAAIDTWLPAFTAVVPVGLLSFALEFVFVHASLVRLMGDLFERESLRIAHRHTSTEA
ncbi:MAG: hypothetical protein AB7F50_11405 [Fimbriimonadaceae bacterium]